MHNGVPPLQRTMRDLAATARHMTPVLEALKSGCVAVDEIARKLGIEEQDARRALFALEECGLAVSTAFRLTSEGRAVK